MKKNIFILSSILYLINFSLCGQTKKDSIEIKKVALDYIESQHNAKPRQFERAVHPRMVKRTFWTDKKQEKNI